MKKQGLKALFARLDARDAAIPLAELQAQLGKTDLVSEDFQRVVAFGDKTYRRNLLHEGPAYHALSFAGDPANAARYTTTAARAARCGC